MVTRFISNYFFLWEVGGMDLSKAPCYHCDDRCVNCHSTCTDYNVYVEQRQKQLEEMHKDLDAKRWTYTKVRMIDRERKKR
mgnify:CR=1 FL=1